MGRWTHFAISLLLGCVTALPAAWAGGEQEERSPFDMVRWTERGPEVQVDGTWYEFLSLDGRPLDVVVRACKKIDSVTWEKRFCEDLVAALATIGHDIGPTVTLGVRVPGTRETLVLKDVRATNEKRNRIRDARPWKAAAAASVKRIDRKHAARVHKDFEDLTRRYSGERGERLSRKQARADLDQLEWLIDNVFSYRDLQPFDYRAALDSIRAGIDQGGIPRKDFHVQLRKLVALFGDGHSRVRGVTRALPGPALPFALAEADGRVVALEADGTLLDPKHPYVEAIAGRPIGDWVHRASLLDAQGSRAFRRAHGLRNAVYFRFLEDELALPNTETLAVALSGTGGEVIREWDVLPGRPIRWRRKAREAGPWAAKGIRHVRIAQMRSEPAFLDDVLQGVLGSPKTKALVLDVRGNGGGRRMLLKALLPHLMPADAAPLVCNVAAYRLPPGETYDAQAGNLSNRFLRPPGWSGWTDLERAVAAVEVRALTSFEPPFARDPRRFTPLHLMLVSPASKGAPRFLGPIAILIDGGCFSATDVFVGALEQLPNVTLIGTPTGGGSGRSRSYRLAHSGLEVRLSSMASFRPNGALYDGKGIAPDVEVRPTLDDLLGKTDTTLETAVAHLKKR